MMFWYPAMRLAVESSAVIQSRMHMLASGHMTRDELHLMSSEKVDAALEACSIISSGGSPSQVISRYRERVAANAIRLGKSIRR